MATPTLFDDQDYAVARWVGETGTGGAANMVRWPDKTVAFTGTGTLEVEGSMDGTNWFTLNDNAGAPISALAANVPAVILENPIFVRPVITGGTASVYITGKE